MKAGFIGLGNMGAPMARNLIGAGHQLAVYNRTGSRAGQFQPLGARVAETPGDAASQAEALITMLADDRALEDVVFAPGNSPGWGILDRLPAGAVHISMSTISVQLSRRLAAAHHEKGQHYVSAPVLGRPDAAAAAKLFIIAAGPGEQVERCRPLFDALGQKTFFAGEDAAAANSIKLAANFLLTAMIEGLAEAFAFVRRAGIDAKAFLDILTGSLFNTPVYRNYGAIIASDIFEPAGFKLSLGFKDNRLLNAAAEEYLIPMPLAGLVHDRFLAALAQGLGGADWAAIARISYQGAGLAETAK
ncbi:MAG: NAD(P)-dependent oxidoreductase [Nitrospiraceae bacterium]|nr:NAD(P)-dependent oxidoreductase [Nitrospiraceae bacterium]